MNPPNPFSEPSVDPSELPEEIRDCFIKSHDKWTIDQMQSMKYFLQQKIDSIRNVADSELTIEDFEKVKKQDIDNDQEEGEE